MVLYYKKQLRYEGNLRLVSNIFSYQNCGMNSELTSEEFETNSVSSRGHTLRPTVCPLEDTLTRGLLLTRHFPTHPPFLSMVCGVKLYDNLYT